MNYMLCTTTTTDPIIVFSENRSRISVVNNNRIEIEKIQVDGCLIDVKLEKCDWLFCYGDNAKKAVFIELKGCDLDKAISQLRSTINHTKERYRAYKKECYAITTRVPKHGASIRKRSIDFFNQTGATLSVKNSPHSINI
ncbi:hypothetical protein [Pseudomonas thivervalensis]|uniref:hypothetical protein n=1 Tax=Pseudomonas thivervalensis TaxID=86265 RepID=UPI003D65EEF9